MRKNSFVLYTDCLEQLEVIPDAERGILFLEVLRYARTGVVPNIENPFLKALFLGFKNQIDRDCAKYEEVCKKRAEAGRNGGNQRVANLKQSQASGSNCNQNQANSSNCLNVEANASNTKQSQASGSNCNQNQANSSNCLNVEANASNTKQSQASGSNIKANQADNDSDNDSDNVIDIKKSEGKTSRFTPPTIQEVKSFIDEKGYSIDAETFIAFYESNGWMVGKNKMKDWRMAIVTWSKRDNVHPQRKASANKKCNDEWV